ncbi:MAG: gamma-glutamylcyclotransferase family protein [bacterium]
MPRGNVKMLYYFCCGAPLMDRSLDRRVDSLRLEGQGRLDGLRMSFSGPKGRPNLEASSEAKTWGCLYLIDERKLAELDKEEPGAARREGKVLFEGGLERCVYFQYPPQSQVRPSHEFLETLRSTYMQAGLPQAQIDQAQGLALK